MVRERTEHNSQAENSNTVMLMEKKMHYKRQSTMAAHQPWWNSKKDTNAMLSIKIIQHLP